MKDFNEVIEERQREWEELGLEKDLPFKAYYDRVTKEIQRMDFHPTPQQLDFLLDLDNVTLVDSTAGSGKTTTITIKSILDEIVWGINSYNIVFLTFSRKSAQDMRQKRDHHLRKYYGAKNYARMSTLHSLCFKFLQTYYKEPGGMHAFGKNRLIADQLVSLAEADDSFGDMSGMDDFDDFDDFGDYTDYSQSGDTAVSVIDIMKRFINEDKSLEYINNMNEMRNIMSCFSYQKERMLKDEQIIHERIFRSLECEAEDYFKLRKKVEDYKKMFEYYDFTDLQEKTLEILRNHREFFYSDNTFKTVFKPVKLYVDEVQDMTPLQKQLIRELAELPVDDGRRTSIVCIGDGDQTIYTWRGSDTLQFDMFQEVFDPEKVKSKLKIFSKNHRCGANILEKAEELINNNTLRNPKQMTAREGNRGNFEVVHYMNSKDMIKLVVEEVVQQMEEKGKEDLENIAIIYREHAQVMGIVTALLRLDIPFDLAGMKLPYKHWIFKALLDMCDSLLFDHREYTADVIYKFTSLNKKEAAQVKEAMTKLSYEKGSSVGWLDVLKNNLSRGVKPFVSKDSLVELLTIKKALSEPNASIQTVLQKLYSLYTLHNLGYVLKNLIYVERAEIEAVEYFINSIPREESFEELIKNIDNWDRFIANYKSQRYGVKMMTMHSTKGLEFKKVMIVGMDGDYCPKENYLKELEADNQLEYIEEERRLFFVGITRAIEECVVFTNIINPSRFLYEIDPTIKPPEEIPRKQESIQQKEQRQPLVSQSREVKVRFTNKTQKEKIYEEELLCFLKIGRTT